MLLCGNLDQQFIMPAFRYTGPRGVRVLPLGIAVGQVFMNVNLQSLILYFIFFERFMRMISRVKY